MSECSGKGCEEPGCSGKHSANIGAFIRQLARMNRAPEVYTVVPNRKARRAAERGKRRS